MQICKFTKDAANSEQHTVLSGYVCQSSLGQTCYVYTGVLPF